MPSDIRSFFGGKASAPIREKETKKEDDSKRRRSSKSLRDFSLHDTWRTNTNIKQKPAKSSMIVTTILPHSNGPLFQLNHHILIAVRSKKSTPKKAAPRKAAYVKSYASSR